MKGGVADAMKLTYKQRLFVDEYIISGNATQSCKAAGSTPPLSFDRDVNKLRILTSSSLKD